MVDREAFYRRLPPLLQHVAVSAEGWRLERFRFGKAFDQELAAAVSRFQLDPEQVIRLRDKRLREFARHAYETVPFYRARFDEHGVNPGDVAGIDDLAALPILSKREVQEAGSAIVSQAVPPKAQRLTHTSGTTGGGLEFPTTHDAIREQWAVWWRYRLLHGLRRGTWCGYFGGRFVVPLDVRSPPFWRYDLPGRRILFSGYHMDYPEVLDQISAELRRRRPPWLHGYPSLLALLASHVVDESKDLGYRVKWVTLGAENVLAHQIDAIERAFGVAPLQHYGLAEAVGSASQCRRGHLHCDEDFAAMELVDNGAGQYRVIGTNLSNLATPLIRYDTMDLASHAAAECECGLPGRVIGEIDGRVEETLVLASGRRLGLLDVIFKDVVNIREAQIVQHRLDAVVLRIVRGSAYSEADESKVLAQARNRIGPDLQIEIEYVDALERSKRGKLRLVVSDIPGSINYWPSSEG